MSISAQIPDRTELARARHQPPNGSARDAGGRLALIALLALAVVAAWVFFHRLGAAPLTDWDEAWHAEVAREIVTSGDWLDLHCRGEPYFNKPPLAFWFKAVAMSLHGPDEASARFFPALFGWGTVMLAAAFLGRAIGRAEGLLAGAILTVSWLFTTYHAGRSAEADSTLIFFSVLTIVLLWRARRASGWRWFVLAAVSTAAGWWAKGSSAYWPWAVAAVIGGAAGARRRWWKRWAGGACLTYALTLPWQAVMLWRHGLAFARIFYLGEGVLPALRAIEDHPGDWRFYFQILHAFFEPWLALAGAAAIAAVFGGVRREREPERGPERRAAIAWLVAWAAVILASCTLFSTKMIWYATPATPALAGLAAVTAVGLCRRRGGCLLLAGAAAFAIWHARTLDLEPAAFLAAGAVCLSCGAALVLLPLHGAADGRPNWASRWNAIIGVLCLAAPMGLHARWEYRAIVDGEAPSNWTSLRTEDQPWREVAMELGRRMRGRPVLLAGLSLDPPAYFYLARERGGASGIEEVTVASLGPRLARDPQAVAVVRVELVDSLRALGLAEKFREGALVVMAR